ncbi:MAG: hypothetical protein EA356_15045 [Geminicoccaceae bacterium]|nr:MAG: hypothetical protein EA356_15045 [Geminicoccaceae bacterium]
MRRSTLSPDDAYRPAIPNVDVRAAAFRECEAMLAYAAASGLVLDDETRSRIGLLDVGIVQRRELAMSELFDLHGRLARLVEPATPRGLELMRWDAQRYPRAHRLAPVPALRSLLLIAVVFLVAFCAVGVSGLVTTATVERSLLSFESRLELAALLLFYFSLAGIGATFKALYDAYQFVQEGRYDPRLESTYYIRIGLGLISGLLLAQVLNQFVAAGEGLALGKPLLAILGGFAAQVVYSALSRLVEAVESVFRADLRTQLQLQEREQRANRQAAEAARQATIAGKGAALAAAIERSDDATRRRALVGELMENVLPGFAGAGGNVVAGTAPPTAGGAVDFMFQRAGRWLALGRTVADLLPGERAAAAQERVREVRKALEEAETFRGRLRGGDAVGAVQQVLGRVVHSPNPLTPIFQTALLTFATVLGRGLPGLAAVTPKGLALGIVASGAKLRSEAYARWKARVLAAPYHPDLLPPATLTFNSVLPALQLSPAFAAAFEDLLAEPEPRIVLEIGELALQDDGSALRSRYPDRFPNATVFASGLEAFRQALLTTALTPELPPELLTIAGTDTAATLLAGLDAVRADPTARQDLELLALLGDRVRTGEVEMAEVEAALREAEAGT